MQLKTSKKLPSMTISTPNRIRWYATALLSLILLSVIGLYSRTTNVESLFNVSFADGGRELLVTKRIAEERLGLDIAPWTTFSLIPNTPLLYWIMVPVYTNFNFIGINYMNAIMGVGIVLLSYYFFIILFKNHWLAFLFGVMTALSPGLISESVQIWQPYLQHVFLVGSLVFTTLALATKRQQYYWLAALFFFPSLSLHASAIPVIIIFSTFIIFDFRNQVKNKKYFKHPLFFYLLLGAVWISWLYLTYIVVGINHDFAQPLQQNFQFLFSKEYIYKIANTFKATLSYIGAMSSMRYLPSMLISIALILVVIKNYFFGPLTKQLTLLFLLLLSTLTLAFIPYGTEFRAWYFFTQIFCCYLLLGILPILLFGKNRRGYFAQLLWVAVLIIFGANSYFDMIAQKSNPFDASKEIASMIISDTNSSNIAYNDFIIIPKHSYSSENSIQALTLNWNSASVQLALEMIDSKYSKRISVVPLKISPTNIVQPDSKNTYVICLGYQEKTKENCIMGIFSEKSSNISASLIGNIHTTEYNDIFLYRIKEV